MGSCTMRHGFTTLVRPASRDMSPTSDVCPLWDVSACQEPT